MKKETLDKMIDMIPIMKSMVDEDMAISIWDIDGTVLHFQKAESFPLHFEIGYRLEDKNDKIFQAMNSGKTIHNSLPKEVFGVAIEGNLVPIFEEGRVAGCIACVFPKEAAEELKEKNEIIREIHGSINELESNVKGVYGVVDSIKKNTASIKMLALNASIEAARAGEYGRGFTIVAHEMGKLSQMSSESVSGINGTLDNITKSIKNVTGLINKID